ncbi:MAG: hypothetical protein U0822_08580 [Anaerolineae bacterium]
MSKVGEHMARFGMRAALVGVALLSVLVTLTGGASAAMLPSSAPAPTDANWASIFGLPGVNQNVYAMASDGNGAIYAGGAFPVAGSITVNYVARWDGSMWSPMGSGLNGTILAMAIDGHGNVYVGGSFSSPGANIAMWNGSSWTSLGSGLTGLGASVNALAVDGQGNVYVGGTFTTAGGVPANRIAKWDGTTWSAMGSGMNNVVNALAVDGTGNVYAGGAFTTAGGVTVNSIARWDGTAWSALTMGAKVGVDNSVYALAFDGSGNLYAGGDFSNAGTVAANRVAKWNGTAWVALGTAAANGATGTVRAIVVDSGNVYMGGLFSTIGGSISASHIAVWNGTNWSALGSGTAAIPGISSADIYALALNGRGKLFAAGSFGSAGGLVANRIAQWDGTAWTTLGQGADGIVSALLYDHSRGLYAAGSFTHAGGLPVNYVARWDGAQWSMLGTLAANGTGGPDYALALDTSGNLYVGGSFTGAGGVAANNVAKWDGATWSALGAGVNGSVNALAVDASGNVYVGGTFTSAGGAAADGIAMWNQTSGWSSLGTGSHAGDNILAIAIDGTKVYAGGSYSQIGGIVATNLAMWNGTSWSPISTGANNTVTALALDSTGALYVAFGSQTIGLSSYYYIAKWSAPNWYALGTGVTGIARALAVDRNNNLYATGNISIAGGTPPNRTDGVVANGITMWNGSSWSALADGLNTNTSGGAQQGYALALGNHGDVWVGGPFLTAGGKPSAHIAKWNPDTTPPVITPTVSGTQGSNGWYISPVTVIWSVTDPESDVVSSAGCGTTTLTADTAGTTLTCSATNGAGLSSSASVTVKIDQTVPTASPVQTPGKNGAGWNNSDVTVTWNWSDGSGAGLDTANCATSSASSGEGALTLTAQCKDLAGNTGSASYIVQVDKSLPSITGGRSPSANSYGWNNTDVTASFTCSDGLSGIATCSGPTVLSAEGTGQSVTGTAVDNAGNSATATVGNINIDKIVPAPPTANVSPAPNAAGWNNSAVILTWTDNGDVGTVQSGVASCTSTGQITGEGTNQYAGTCTDKAGNQSSASHVQVNLDETPPHTTADAPAGWNNSSVTITLTASDNLSGVKATYYILDGGATQGSTSVSVVDEGIHSLEFWSVDNADNVEAHHTVQLKIDKTPPTISHTQSPDANANGWNNTTVTVHFICADALSGIASCTGWTGSTNNGVSAASEGQSQPVPGTAVDNAGNTATDPATVSIDETAPKITAAADRAANGNGWYNADVSVAFTCADQGAVQSGIATCSATQTVSEGANQSATGTATDAAGNSASITLSGLNVDKTPPLLSGAATTPPNARGWYHADVTVQWTCSDALSGIDGGCPTDSTVTGEGNNLSAIASVADRAGNSASASVGGIQIDRTPPTTLISAPTGWVNADVSVMLAANDGLSGVDATYYIVDGSATQTGTSFALSTEGVHTVEYWSVDRAGNEEAHHTSHVSIDKTAPSASPSQSPAANGIGWNSGDVTVAWHWSDSGAGLDTANCTTSSTSSGEGTITLTATCKDLAGNTGISTYTVNVDKTAPTANPTQSPTANTAGWNSGDVTVTWNWSDGSGSGLDGAHCTTTSAPSGEGTITLTAQCTDLVGNTGSASYTVKVDKTAPTASPTQSPGKNGAGWNNSDVTVNWNWSDGSGSGLDPANCTTSSLASDEGTMTLTAQCMDLAGNSASASYIVKVDETPPSANPTQSPDGNGQVMVTWNWSDGSGSGLDPAHCATSSLASGQGTVVVNATCTDLASNTGSASATVNVSTAPPVAHPSQTPAANTVGWNKSDVTVTWNWSDPSGTGLDTANCEMTTVSTGEGTINLTAQCKNRAGNIGSASYSVKVDKTAPTIAYSGNVGSYTIDQTVAITCSAADDLSGLASNTCANISGPAYNFNLGNNTYSASATDNAGNTTTASASFSVRVTYDGLAVLTSRFVTNAGVAHGLNAKLSAAQDSATRGNITARNNQLNAYINDLQGQIGKTISSTQADILIRLVRALMS